MRQRVAEVLPGALPWVAAGGAALAVLLLLTVLVRLRRVQRAVSETSTLAAEQLAGQLETLGGAIDGIAARQEGIERSVRQEIAQNRAESGVAAREGRAEVMHTLTLFGDSLQARSRDIATLQQEQLGQFGNQLGLLLATIEQRLGTLTQTNEGKLESLRKTVDERLGQIHRDNAEKLESMRQTVDERLHGTLEQRLGESFKQVSERLEHVHKGLGEMQVLAAGVGDLKKVLTNVKTRGGWGEVQLEALLEQLLSPEQYERNVRTREGSAEVVEFAIRLPGKPEEGLDFVWLPIDAKFPLEDYQRLVDASHEGDRDLVELAARALEKRVRQSAKEISTKYLSPPRTTDFAVMFLPTEGLYAEVVRRDGLMEAVQRDHRIVVAGPSTFAALLNSLQMGFRTLAIQERSSEVWRVLGAVKTEFRKFGDVLDGVKKKLDQASNTMDEAAKRSRALERKLRQVEELPAGEAQVLLGTVASAPDELDEAV
ncbi:MAG: DNA recombination protein RmuC [Deltaproteobacteria bacterium]|nr:DNA recombination protein RmuC [Deltaproteobacteria bacterium]